MSEKFRIGKDEYRLRKPIVSSKQTNQISKIAKELEAARNEGKYSEQANNVASRLPKGAFKIVEEYIKEHDRKLYGGTALNMQLPRGHKIYKRNSLPDYDFFSPDPWNDTVNISDLLYKAGYKYTEAKSGVHKGTFKVFADFWPVADITYLPPDIYAEVPTVKKNGFTVITPAYLQMTLYDMISKPIEAPTRWPKVAYRQKLLEKWVPPKYRKKQCAADFVGADEYIDVNPALKKALEVVYREARKEKLIHYGPLAYNKFVEIAGGDKRMPVIYYQLLAQDAGIHAAKIGTEISKVIDNALVHDVFYQQYKDMNQLSYELSIKVGTEQFPVFTITELSRCVPYKYIGGRFYCSIDYLFYELYYQMFHEESRVYEHNVSCLIRYLQRVQQQYYKEKGITELDNSPLQRFVTKCKGPYVDVMRESFYSIWVDRAKARAKITDVLPKGDTIGLTGVKDRPIRVYPVESEQCTGKEEDDCDYPCNWVDKIGKCSGIPVTGYRPGQPGPKKVSGGAVVDLK